ncbi:protein of unknown function DUF218 [Kineococcus radiotolerans SRS30216 = ATCC BAA-149]|uniref:DUF218 domain-containing protein n=1 Tax=Kineococcus radiotolerans (strain ATCC BAA-149 / DSM 14245 / SRS30216) TaxID=266940 RepID=A6WE22_KINRD|nr:protein of unknown function DUF218 [Kineococcus radiotolerans SRS30216 = ATCC BAA-149]
MAGVRARTNGPGAFLGPGLLAAAATVLAVELVHAVAARCGFPGGRGGGEPDVVLVLGHPSRRDGTLHPVQRWRTEIAVRSSSSALLVFSGYAPARGRSEAAVMAEHARRVLGVAPGRLRREEAATSTWDNIAFTLDDLAAGSRIAIASSPVHALRARRYLRRLRPDLAARLVPADDYRPGERWGWKAATVLYDGARSLRLRVGPATAETSEVAGRGEAGAPQG